MSDPVRRPGRSLPDRLRAYAVIDTARPTGYAWPKDVHSAEGSAPEHVDDDER